jgi:hypothetical protein
LAGGADGSVYALALSDSASASRATPSSVTGQTAEGASVVVAVTSTEAGAAAQTEQPAKSRYELSAAKAAVFRISPDGANEIIWSSAGVTGFSLLANPNGNGVLLGTSDRGRIYSIGNDGRETLLLQSNEGQISTLLARGSGIFATSSNQGRLYSFGAETLSEGSYESSVRDARTTALWGRIWWRSTGNVQLQTRTGNTEKPNETWSDWSSAMTDAKGAQITSPKARFLQWRAVLNTSANLNEVNVSYLPQNIAPEVLSIQILPANVGLASNPAVPVDPNIENSGVDPQAFGLPAAMNVGRYIFKVVAKDTPSNTASQALSGERISEPIDVDNTAPTVIAATTPQVTGETGRVTFEATDAASFVRRAEYSVNGGEWQTVYADDGISDGARERYTLQIPLRTPGDYSVTLRVFDESGNVGNARVVMRR